MNDVELLKSAIPGCETFEPVWLDNYNVSVNAAIGPVKTVKPPETSAV